LTESKPEVVLLDLERDIPTTKEDSEILWKLSRQPHENLLKNVNQLLAPGWTLEKARSLPFFDGCEPFRL
jgi:hypothetical protein